MGCMALKEGGVEAVIFFKPPFCRVKNIWPITVLEQVMENICHSLKVVNYFSLIVSYRVLFLLTFFCLKGLFILKIRHLSITCLGIFYFHLGCMSICGFVPILLLEWLCITCFCSYYVLLFSIYCVGGID